MILPSAEAIKALVATVERGDADAKLDTPRKVLRNEPCLNSTAAAGLLAIASISTTSTGDNTAAGYSRIDAGPVA